MFNMFSGGALSRFTVFALGIMPYISASIIMQLMTSSCRTLEALKKEGESGRRKITQYTRYGTLGLAMFQALGIALALELAAGLVHRSRAWRSASPTVVTLVTGTMFLMWLGEQITERGLGNGISIIIFARHRGRPAERDRRPVRAGAHRRDEHPGRAVHHRRWSVLVTFARGVRRTRPAQDPGQLRQAPGRQQGLRRPERRTCR